MKADTRGLNMRIAVASIVLKRGDGLNLYAIGDLHLHYQCVLRTPAQRLY